MSTNRYSKDVNKIDKYGKRLLDLCNSRELFFVNGRIGNDFVIGKLTCTKCVIDYVIVSPLLFRSVVDFNVLSFDPILSDIHMPITLNLCTNIGRVVSNSIGENIDFTNDTYIVITGNSEYSVKLRWSAERAPVFVDSLSQDRIDELLDRLNIIDVQTVDAAIVNDITEDCNNIIKSSAENANMFVKKNASIKCQNVNSRNKAVGKKYFNTDCYVKRKEYRKAKKYYYRVCSIENHKVLVSKSRDYKNTLQTLL